MKSIQSNPNKVGRSKALAVPLAGDRLRSVTIILAALIAMVGLVAVGQAAPISPFSLPNGIDLGTSVDSVSYTSASQQFTVLGMPTALDFGETPTNPDINAVQFGGTPTYTISALISNAGTLVSGTLTVTGTIPLLNLPDSGILLQGDITQFGYNPPNLGVSEFQFVISNLEGDLAPWFESGDAYALLVTGTSGNFTGSFASNWSITNPEDTFLGLDTAGVFTPEPASATLCLAGLAGCLGLRRRRRQSL